MVSDVNSAALARLAALAHALSDTTRLEVLAELRQGERCVCDLTSDLQVAQSRLSFHLRVLREAGLVTDRREGRWSFYRLAPGALEELVEGVTALRPDVARRLVVTTRCD
jgi:ArsR family transcriptional regulator